MEQSTAGLRRGLYALAAYAVLMTIAVVLLFLRVFTASPGPGPSDGILRARGLIIQDAQGRDRILIGAPVPDSAARVRTNFRKAVDAWGKRFPSMDWYKTLDNSTNGILLLDDRGFDRIAIGDPTPDPNIGRRISPATGIQINDQEGFERTGWGYFAAKGRVVLGLDSARGQEGVTAFILEDNTTGLSINAGEKSLFLGSAPGEAAPPEFGLLFKEKGRTVKAVTEAKDGAK
jgi:hypothetical protein